MPASQPVVSREEFTQLYAAAQQPLYAYLLTLVPHPADADEVLQETAVLLWQRVAEYDPRQPFLPWALAFARFQAMKYRKYSARHRARTVALSEEAFESLAGDEGYDWQGAAQRADIVAACVRQLPEDDRRLLELRYHGPGTIRELAGGDEQLEARLYKRLQRIREALWQSVRARLRGAEP